MRAVIERHLAKFAAGLGAASVLIGYFLGADPSSIDACLTLIAK